MSWTDEEYETVRVMWFAGASASEVARVIGRGKSRNAVIGIVHRRGWIRQTPQKPAASPRVQRAKVPKTGTRGTISVLRVTPPPADKVKPTTPKRGQDFSLARPWQTRKFGECAFPVGERGDLRSCCRPTTRTYCPACEAVMYQPKVSKAPAAAPIPTPRRHQARVI